MTYVYDLFLVLHFVGLAMLLGGFIVQVKSPDKTIDRWMRDGALLQFITGVIMMGLGSAGALESDEAFNNSVIGIKLLVLIVIIILAFVARAKKGPQPALWGAAGVLTLVNILIAVFGGVVGPAA